MSKFDQTATENSRRTQISCRTSDRHNTTAAIIKYQAFLAGGTGLPNDGPAQIELMAANTKMVEKIRTEIKALEHELDEQEKSDKITLLTQFERTKLGRCRDSP